MLLNHKPKISNKLPLTRAEKSIIGSTPLDTTADNNKSEEIEHSQYIDSLKNKRARKEALFERLDREHTIQQRACKRKSAPEKPVRKKRQCSSLTHDLRNCPDRRSVQQKQKRQEVQQRRHRHRSLLWRVFVYTVLLFVFIPRFNLGKRSKKFRQCWPSCSKVRTNDDK